MKFIMERVPSSSFGSISIVKLCLGGPHELSMNKVYKEFGVSLHARHSTGRSIYMTCDTLSSKSSRML